MVGGDAFASFSWDTRPFATGSHTLSLLVRDGVGRTATASISVIVTPARRDSSSPNTSATSR